MPSHPQNSGGCSKCGMLACVCEIQRQHKHDCKFRIAATLPIGIACEHGRDCCPICDPCTCGAGIGPGQVGRHHFKTLEKIALGIEPRR